MVYAYLLDVSFDFGEKKEDEQYFFWRNRERFIGNILVYFCIEI